MNLRNPCTTSSRRRICAVMIDRCSIASGRSRRAELLLEQFEMNHRGIQRVLHLVRDAGRQPAERRQLLRVADRGLHLRHVVEVARDEHHGGEPMIEVVDHVRQDQSLARRRQPVLVHPIGREARAGTPRWAARLRLAVASSTALRYGCSGGEQIAHRPRRGRADPAAAWPASPGWRTAASPSGRRWRRRLRAGRCSRRGRCERRPRRGRRAVGRQPRAHGVEEIAELAEFVVLRQIHHHAELALPQSGEAAADDVNRPEQQLGQQHRHQAAADQDGDRGDQAPASATASSSRWMSSVETPMRIDPNSAVPSSSGWRTSSVRPPSA